MGPVLQLREGMKKQIAYLIIGLMAAAAQVACGHKSSTAADASQAPVVASSLSVYAASSIVALGATTTITVSGGSGTYVTAVATLGSLVATGATTFTYTAPASATTAYETVTITDSNGLSGSTYLTISGATGTTTGTSGTTSCSGTYTVSLGGVPATMVLVGGSGNYVAGYLDMWNYKFSLYGSCTITGTSGTITVTEGQRNSTFNGTVSLSGSTISMTGTASNSLSGGGTANWTATSTTSAVTVAAPTSNSCQGTYNATIGPNTGQILLTQDGNGKIGGVMVIQGYYYALYGTCSGTSINFTNVTSGSTYTGTATFTTSGATLSGSYVISGGTTYNWSATR